MIYADVMRFRRTPEVYGPERDLCLSLWTEKKYHLSVDGPSFEVFDCCALNSVLVEERFNPDVPWGPRTLSTEGVQFVSDSKARSEYCDIPMFIPSIAKFIDADLDRYRDNVDKKLRNVPCLLTKPLHTLQLVQFLHFELPYQRELILSEIAPRNRQMIIYLIDCFRAKSSSIFAFTPELEANVRGMQLSGLLLPLLEEERVEK